MRSYYWLFARNVLSKSGKFKDIFDGPYDYENDAYDSGFKKYPGVQFEVMRFPTRDRGHANQMRRAELAGKGEPVGNLIDPCFRNI